AAKSQMLQWSRRSAATETAPANSQQFRRLAARVASGWSEWKSRRANRPELFVPVVSKTSVFKELFAFSSASRGFDATSALAAVVQVFSIANFTTRRVLK
ncbi:MAG: hypothetical protein OEZ06_31765, partial [Myxococcales bacterium]|nr:hypothetical protein [Myxococcales bacterium]